MIAAIYIFKNSYPHLFGEGHQEMTINFGAKYIYQARYNEGIKKLVVNKELNQTYIEPILSKINNSKNDLIGVSCIVGSNGAGKSTILKDILIDYRFIFIEENNDKYKLVNLNKRHEQFRKAKFVYHRVYYTPILNFEKLESIGDNSVDLSKTMQFINDNHGDSGQLNDFVANHSSECIKRWIRFNNFYLTSNINIISIPFFKKVSVDLNPSRHTIYDKNYHDTPYQFRPIFNLLFDKIKSEKENLYLNLRNSKIKIDDIEDRRIKFEYHFYDDLLGKLISCFESTGNHFLDEGYVPEDLEEKINDLNIIDSLYLFLQEAHVYDGKIEYKFNDLVLSLQKLLDFFIPIIKKGNVSTDDWTIIFLDYSESLKLIDLYDEFNNFFNIDPFSFNDKPLFIYSPDINLSTGEQAVLNLFSTLYHHKYCIDHNIKYYDFHAMEPFKYLKDKILLLIDEGDSGFHPAWKKKYIRLLRELVPEIYKGFKVQILLTTHDPITLSDFPKNNIVFLEKRRNESILLDSNTKKTFAANISELLEDSFFLENGLIGDWSNKIVTMFIKALNNGVLNKYEISESEIKSFISSIDEPIVKFKIAEMYSNYSKNKNVEIELIEQEIHQLLTRRKELE